MVRGYLFPCLEGLELGGLAGLGDVTEHDGVVVGQAHVELLQLYLGHSLLVPAGLVLVEQSPHGGQHVAPAPHLQVDRDGIDDGQSCLRLLPQDAGEVAEALVDQPGLG